METNRGAPETDPEVLSKEDRFTVNNNKVHAAINTKAAKIVLLRLFFSARISLLLPRGILATKRHIRQKIAFGFSVPLCGFPLFGLCLLTPKNRMVSCQPNVYLFSKMGEVR